MFADLLSDALSTIEERFPPPSTTPSKLSKTTTPFPIPKREPQPCVPSPTFLLPKREPSPFNTSPSLTTSNTPAFLADLEKSSPDFDWPAYFQEDINQGISRIWALSTLKTYSTAINAYLNFCRLHRIPMRTAFPASEPILCAFFSNKLHLSAGTLKNYLSGLRAWHIKDDKPFPSLARLRLIAFSPRPPKTPAKIKEPVEIADLQTLHDNLDGSSSLDIACFTCSLVAFFGLCRLGELLLTSCSQTQEHLPSPSAIQFLADHVKLTLPWSKVSRFCPSDIFLAHQSEPLDPINALREYLNQNYPSRSGFLFVYSAEGKTIPLTKSIFLSQVNSVLTQCGRHVLTGHSFRIGGTTHFLLCGVHPDVIRQHGRWSSDSFLRYWQNLDHIIPSNVCFASPGLEVGGPPKRRLGHGQASVGGTRVGAQDSSRKIWGLRVSAFRTRRATGLSDPTRGEDEEGNN